MTDDAVHKPSTLAADLANACNRACAENGSNTPDFILAEYLLASLAAFDAAVKRREAWYGHEMAPGMNAPVVAGTAGNRIATPGEGGAT